jgi:uncharacterized membrane protein (DUF2068 family)
MDAPSSHSPPVRQGANRHSAPLIMIGAFKLIKTTLLVALGVWALQLVHGDVAADAAHWIERLHLDPGNHYVAAVLSKLAGLDDHRLKEIGAVSFFYAALFLIEGTGLCLRKRWAEYMTTVLTASALPFEILGIANHVTTVRIGLLIANLAILGYLIAILRQDRRNLRSVDAADSTSKVV